MIINSTICSLGKLPVPNPEFGDMKLNIFPIKHLLAKLPEQFKLWQSALDSILKYVPYVEYADTHYVTIDSKFFATDDFLRREGVHADGNFCVDPNFKNATWGGTTATWGGASYNGYKVIKDWELPYDIEIPLGEYITSEKGGIFCASSEVGCKAWSGEFYGEIGSGGDFSSMSEQLTYDKEITFNKNQLYFMTSNTPHETLMNKKGQRRTFIRLTLNHEYPTNLILQNNRGLHGRHNTTPTCAAIM